MLTETIWKVHSQWEDWGRRVHSILVTLSPAIGLRTASALASGEGDGIISSISRLWSRLVDLILLSTMSTWRGNISCSSGLETAQCSPVEPPWHDWSSSSPVCSLSCFFCSVGEWPRWRPRRRQLRSPPPVSTRCPSATHPCCTSAWQSGTWEHKIRPAAGRGLGWTGRNFEVWSV